jgi:hypothetical protein
MLAWVADNGKSLQHTYGNFNVASMAAIKRKLLMLEQQGTERFFGEVLVLVLGQKR